MKWITRMTCGCAVKTDRFQNTTIDYCPKHKSAPDLYEALKSLIEKYGFTSIGADEPILDDFPTEWQDAIKALAKAEQLDK